MAGLADHWARAGAARVGDDLVKKGKLRSVAAGCSSLSLSVSFFV